MRIVLVSAMACGLCACAADVTWTRPGASPQQVAAALDHCEAEGETRAYGYVRSPESDYWGPGEQARWRDMRQAALRGELAAECMEQLGFVMR